MNGISKSSLKIEISEKKKEENLRVLMEKGRKRPPVALKLGGIPAEHSWNVLLELNLANQSATAI